MTTIPAGVTYAAASTPIVGATTVRRMRWEPNIAAAVVDDEGHRLLDICESAPRAPVAACPGWTTTDLAVHTASVFRRVAHWCMNRVTEPVRWPDPAPPDLSNPWGWCRQAVSLVTDALVMTDPEEPVWSWTDRHDGGFYHRRMVHEAVIHRWDAQAAVGSPPAIDADLAADGIDELMSVGMRFRGDGSAIAYPDGTLSIMTVDTGHRWSLAAPEGVLGVGRDDSVITSTDATMTAEASAIMLGLWGRPGGTIDVRGDESTAAAWCAVAP